MSTGEEKLTAMRREYLKVRAAHPGRIILWQKGEFYDLYEDDAKLGVEELGLTLTTASFGKLRVPAAGVPATKLWVHARTLVERGYQVVLVQEQEGAIPAHEREGRRQIDRVVTRVLTRGTLIEPELLDQRASNFLVAALAKGDSAALAYCDVSTGEFAAAEWGGADGAQRLLGEIGRLQPAEILVPDAEALRPPSLTPQRRRLAHDLAPTRQVERARLLPHERLAQVVPGQPVGDWAQGQVTGWATWHWDHQTATDALQQHFKTSSLAGFGLQTTPLAVCAAGALLQYLQETQRDACAQVDRVRRYHPEAFMFLDPQTRRNLELLSPPGLGSGGTLIEVLDQTRTPMGARLLRQWLAQPLTAREPIAARQDSIQRFVGGSQLRGEIRAGLGRIGDLERTAARVVQGTATPRDLVLLRAGLQAVPTVVSLLTAPSHAGAGGAGGVLEVEEPPPALDPCADVLLLLEQVLAEQPPAQLGGWDPMQEEHVIRRGSNDAIERLVIASAEARTWIAGLEAREQAETGIKSLRVEYGAQGWAITIPKTTPQRLIPAHYQEILKLQSEWRFTTAELSEYDRILAAVRVRLNDLEAEAFGRLREQVASAGERLRRTARALAEADVASALADVAVRGNYVRPQIVDEPVLRIVGGRHPVVEQTLLEPFVPNDTTLHARDAQLLIVTGPNMGGKSTYLRQVALITLLAHIGASVPAEAATIGLVDRIFTRIGAQDDLAAGKSTFQIEMDETANILNNASSRSLIILDELGRGTSTYDGLAIAYAVLEYLHQEPRVAARTLFATHFHELTKLADRHERVRNAHLAVAEAGDQMVFLRRIAPGPAERSFGIQVAALAGLPQRVVDRAGQVLAALERRGAREQQRQALAQLDGASASDGVRMAMLQTDDVVGEALDALDLDELTPLAALAALQSLKELRQVQRAARAGDG